MRGLRCLLAALIALPAPAAGAMPQTTGAQAQAARPADEAKSDVKLVEVVPDLPDFPNAIMASSKEKGPSDGWTHTWERETRTTASFDDVKKFYLEQFGKKGWRVTSTKEKSGKAEWALSKGQHWGRVKVEASSGITKITAEWKAR